MNQFLKPKSSMPKIVTCVTVDSIQNSASSISVEVMSPEVANRVHMLFLNQTFAPDTDLRALIPYFYSMLCCSRLNGVTWRS